MTKKSESLFLKERQARKSEEQTSEERRAKERKSEEQKSKEQKSKEQKSEERRAKERIPNPAAVILTLVSGRMTRKMRKPTAVMPAYRKNVH